MATNSGAHPRPVLLHTTLHMWSSERATSDHAAVSKKQGVQHLRSRHFLADEGGLLQPLNILEPVSLEGEVEDFQDGEDF